MHRLGRAVIALGAAALFLSTGSLAPVHAGGAAAVPRAQCGPGSKPETGAQGRVSAADQTSGRAEQGYTCNMEMLSHYGDTGGYRVHRYVDPAGHECAFYDTTLLFPTNATNFNGPDRLTGVYVLDMKDPSHPVHTDTLLTPAMQSPHESVSLNTKRGLLAADMGYPTFNPGFVDLYDVSQDCRHPVLKSSTPLGILGHEGSFSPDGNTFWVSSTGGKTLTALDVTNPSQPVPLFVDTRWVGHGLNVSDDGNRLYLADIAGFDPSAGLTILDVSQVQARVPNPKVPVVSHINWPEVSIPQTNLPVKIGGHPYLVEIDEFSRGLSSDPKMPVGAARIIDIADDTHPTVISDIRLEVNTEAARAGDEAKDVPFNPLQSYTGHYCSVPSTDEPGVVACSFILSGLRMFDIRDPYHPKEIAYANFPTASDQSEKPSSYVMCAAAFVPERGEVWFSDGNSGFYAVKVTNGVWPFGQQTKVLGQNATRAASAPSAGARPAVQPSSRAPALAATGSAVPAGAALALLALALIMRRARRTA
jgi:hypothetical protein